MKVRWWQYIFTTVSLKLLHLDKFVVLHGDQDQDDNFTTSVIGTRSANTLADYICSKLADGFDPHTQCLDQISLISTSWQRSLYLDIGQFDVSSVLASRNTVGAYRADHYGYHSPQLNYQYCCSHQYC